MKAGRASAFFPQPGHDAFIAHPKGSLDAAQAHAVLVGGVHLVLKLLVVARPLGQKGKGAPAIHATCPLGTMPGTPVLLQSLSVAVRANIDKRR